MSLAPNAGQTLTLQSAKFMVTPGRTYGAQVYARGSGTPKVKLSFFDENDSPVLFAESDPVSLVAGWNRVPIKYQGVESVTAPGAAVYGQVFLSASGSAVEYDNVWSWDASGPQTATDAANYLENWSFELASPDAMPRPCPSSGDNPESWQPTVISGDASRATFGMGCVPKGAPGGADHGNRFVTTSIAAGTATSVKAAWISDRFFADTSETYNTMAAAIRGAWSGLHVRATVRWYREDQDYDVFLREDTIADLTAAPASWTTTNANSGTLLPESVFGRMYLSIEATTSSASGHVDFDSAALHGLGPAAVMLPNWTGQPCSIPNPNDLCQFGTPLAPTASFTVYPPSSPAAPLELPVVVDINNHSQNAVAYKWTLSSGCFP